MTKNEHAARIQETLKFVESTARQHNRAIVAHHEALAAAARECGPDIGLDDDIITAAAAPKNPPPNPQ